MVSAPTAFVGLGGGFVYAENIIEGLFAEKGSQSVEFVLPQKGFVSDLRGVNISRVPIQYGSGLGQRIRAVSKARFSRTTRSVRELNAGVCFYPLTTRVFPAPRNAVVVTTVHDLQHRDLPQLFSLVQRLYRRLFYEGALKRSDFIITISEFSASRVTKVLDIPRKKIRVIPLGVDEVFLRAAPSANAIGDYLLYPASSAKHKNHKVLFEAFRRLRKEYPSIRLVLTGSNPSKIGSLPAGVEHKGTVSQAELVDLYANAKLLVFPSKYEGFGLPVLEAMATGTPVVCSNLQALREICGDDADYFSPYSVEDIVNVVRRALQTDYVERIERGRARARHFSWERCVEEHVRVLDEAISLATNRSG